MPTGRASILKRCWISVRLRSRSRSRRPTGRVREGLADALLHICHLFPDLSMAGNSALNAAIGVRVPVRKLVMVVQIILGSKS